MRDIEFDLRVGSPTAPTPYKSIRIRLPFRIRGKPTPEEEDMVWREMQGLACRLIDSMCGDVRKWGVEEGAAENEGEKFGLEIIGTGEATES